MNFLRSNKSALRDGVSLNSFPSNFYLHKKNWQDIIDIDKLKPNTPIPDYTIPEFDDSYLGYDIKELFIVEVKEIC